MSVAALAILGPLVAAALALLLRRRTGVLALLGAGTALGGALATLVRVAGGERFAATLPGLPGLPLRLVVDPLAATLLTTVAVVDLLVLVYALGYMRDEGGQARFYAGMSCFAAAMQTLVLAGDWILLLAAWELIGCASYLLIGFWFARPGVGAAATRAFLTTRAADIGLYVGILLLTTRAGTTEIATTLGVGGATATIAGLALLLAAMGKSAQVPFQGWLQDAMAGPTPVSALLHSATLVAAGPILLLRVAAFLPPGVLLIMGLVGGVTALLAGVMAVAQGDLKRLLAASTSSQLGFMFLAIGAGFPGAAALHLIAQAAMKGALFTGAGVFQHVRGSTAFAELAGVGRGQRRVFAGFAIAGLALAGVPPLAGFWSKDAIVAATFAATTRGVLAPLALLGAAVTGVYMARALRLLWHGNGRDRPLDGGGPMRLGTLGLAMLAALLGVIGGPLARFTGLALPETPLAIALGLVAATLGLLMGWLAPASRLLGRFRAVAVTGFRVGDGFTGLIVRPVLALARAADGADRALHRGVLAVGAGTRGTAGVLRALDARNLAGVAGVGRVTERLGRRSRLFDERGIDGLIAGLMRATRALGGRARRLQSGLVHRELALAAVGVVVLMIVLLLGGVAGR